jgi:hypothetical protein
MLGVDFKSDERSLRWKRSGQPDGAVSPERSDLEDPFRALNASQQVKQFAEGGSDIDWWKPGHRVRLQGSIQRRIGPNEILREVTVNRSPKLWTHVERIAFAPNGSNPACALLLPEGII